MARKKQIGNITNDMFMQTSLENGMTFDYYLLKLMDISISMYDWQNVPDTIDIRFLEKALFCKGYALFFQDDVIGPLALPCMIGGRLNVYNIPIDRTAYAANGYNAKRTAADSVIIYNNMIHTSEILPMLNYAKRLYLLDRIIDINVNAQKTPILIACDEKTRLTLKNVYQKYEGNAPVIFGTDMLNPAVLQAINTGAPFLADKLYQLRTDIWNEALSAMGISNLQISKKERLIRDEVQRMNAGSIASRYSKLHSRKEACDKINKMFGLNISVELREDIDGSALNTPEKSPNIYDNVDDTEEVNTDE